MAVAEVSRGEKRTRPEGGGTEAERRPPPYSGFDAIYCEIDYQYRVHDYAYTLIDEAWAEFARRSRDRRLEIPDEALPDEDRARRQAEQHMQWLVFTVQSLESWTDSLGFHEAGKRNTILLKAVCDWLSAHPETRTKMDADGVFDQTRQDTPETRMEIEMCGTFRSFLRKCKPAVLRRGYHRVLNCNVPEGGFAAGMDVNGERDIVAWSLDNRHN